MRVTMVGGKSVVFKVELFHQICITSARNTKKVHLFSFRIQFLYNWWLCFLEYLQTAPIYRNCVVRTAVWRSVSSLTAIRTSKQVYLSKWQELVKDSSIWYELLETVDDVVL
jgi:hypothetical protein